MSSGEDVLQGGGSTAVSRSGDVVLRSARPWSRTVIGLLCHLESSGFDAAPAVRGDGFAADGRETLAFVQGDPAPVCWSEPAAYRVGEILRGAHDAAAGYQPAAPQWMPWWGRTLPSSEVVIGHCDAAPWNFLAIDGMPTTLLDWDTAGPVGREWDVAQTAWLNAQLHDDDVAERIGLPSAQERAALLAAICHGYGMGAEDRGLLVGRMIEVATRTSAQEAIDAGVGPEDCQPQPMGLLGGGEPMSGPDLLWAVTWRVRSARWMLENRALLEAAVRG